MRSWEVRAVACRAPAERTSSSINLGFLVHLDGLQELAALHGDCIIPTPLASSVSTLPYEAFQFSGSP